MCPLWMGLVVPDLSFFAGLANFLPDLRVFATSAAPPATTHPSIKESTKGGGRRRWPPSFVDGCAVAGGAADVAETRKSGEK